MAGLETRKGRASSPTVASPRASRLRMARRVGSASAPKVRSSVLLLVTIWLPDITPGAVHCQRGGEPEKAPPRKAETILLRQVLEAYKGPFEAPGGPIHVSRRLLKVPAVNALAPTQSERLFQIAQLAAFLVFAALGAASLVRFRLPKTEERIS
jgi:hypothetical protein